MTSARITSSLHAADYITASHYQEVPQPLWRWPDFLPKEMASKGDGSLIISTAAMDKLQWVRTHINTPLLILSAYRDPLHNKRVGGAPHSRHMQGDAFDIATAHLDRQLLHALCRQAGFTGFGFYPTFLHVDCGRVRHWGKWAAIS